MRTDETETEPRTQRIDVRVTEAEYAEIEALAGKAGYGNGRGSECSTYLRDRGLAPLARFKRPE